MAGAKGWLVTWHPQSGSKTTNAQFALCFTSLAPGPWDAHPGPARSCKVDRALNPHTLSTVRHKEESVRALVCFTGERLEVQTGLPTRLHTGARCTLSCVAPKSLILKCHSTAPLHNLKPLGNSILSFDSISRGVAQRKTQPE